MYKWILFIGACVFWLALVYNRMPYATPDGVMYEMPAECDSDLTEATKDTKVFNQPQSNLAIWNSFLKLAPEGWRLYGVTVCLLGLECFIVMDETLDQELYDDTLHHEHCHIIAGEWHR